MSDYLRTTLPSKVLASKVLEEITQDFTGNRKYCWPSCLNQTPGAVGWEMRIQLKTGTDRKDTFQEMCLFPLRQPVPANM